MGTDPTAQHEPSTAATAPGVTPFGLALVLVRHRKMIAAVAVGAGVVAAVYSLTLPNRYTGITRILPPQQGGSSAAMMLGQLGGGLGALAGGVLGVRSPSELYVGMLRSQSVADALIERHDLKRVYGTSTMVDTRDRLAGDSRFSADKGGFIAIEADAGDPRLAAELANSYVEQLHRLTTTLAISEAAQRRAFFEQQTQQARDKLADVEVRLRQAIDSGGLVSVDAQGRATVETIARLRGTISAQEIQVGAMKAYAAPSNPELQRAEKELASMRAELSRLESGTPGGEAAARGDVKGMGHIRLLRELKYYEALFEALAKQYELARVEEAREAPMVQVLDRASPPERRSGPRRTRIVLSAVLGGLFAGVLAALALSAVENARLDPSSRSRFAALREELRRTSPSRAGRPPTGHS